MKYIIIFLIASNSLFSQFSCDSLVETKIDKFTKKEKTMGRNPIICVDEKQKGFIILPKIIDDEIYILLATNPKKCLGDVKVYFLMENEQLIKGTNRFKYNCDGLIGIVLGYYGMSASDGKEFYVRKVKSIRIELENTFIDYDLTDKQATLLMETLNCMQYKRSK
jgi:hypothetical protein